MFKTEEYDYNILSNYDVTYVYDRKLINFKIVSTQYLSLNVHIL